MCLYRVLRESLNQIVFLSTKLTEHGAHSWHSRLDRRRRVCLVRDVTGSSPDPHHILFCSTVYPVM